MTSTQKQITNDKSDILETDMRDDINFVWSKYTNGIISTNNGKITACMYLNISLWDVGTTYTYTKKSHRCIFSKQNTRKTAVNDDDDNNKKTDETRFDDTLYVDTLLTQDEIFG